MKVTLYTFRNNNTVQRFSTSDSVLLCTLLLLFQAQRSHEEAQVEMARMREQRDVFAESMKTAFMRGVCALNIGGHDQCSAATKRMLTMTTVWMTTITMTTVTMTTITMETSSQQESFRQQCPLYQYLCITAPHTLPPTLTLHTAVVQAPGEQQLESR